MNIRLGLQRISAVWWGFWALLATIIGVWSLLEKEPSGFGFLAALVPIYLLHRLTCWVIGGFFSAGAE